MRASFTGILVQLVPSFAPKTTKLAYLARFWVCMTGAGGSSDAFVLPLGGGQRGPERLCAKAQAELQRHSVLEALK